MTTHGQYECGVYFDMPFDDYLAIPALSSSGIKNLLISSMDFWANSWMNPEPPEEKEARHFLDGRAYHARICEGRAKFEARYVEAFNPGDYPDALLCSDDIKARLRELKEGGASVRLTGRKDELIAQLLAIDESVVVMDCLKSQYAAQHAGREFLARDTLRQINLAAAMIEAHPELSQCFQNGYPEVTVLWIDESYGIPMKARFDFLKIRAIVDLKTFANSLGKPIDRAIYSDIAANKYHIQVANYLTANDYARGFAAQGRIFGEHDKDWLQKYIAAGDEEAGDPNKFIFVFQQKGIAPVARGKIFPKGLVLDCGREAIRSAKEIYCRYMESHGTESPWVDCSSIDHLEDEGFPVWIAEA